MEAVSISGSTFHCKLCNVTLANESEVKKHLLTLKHKNGGIMQAFRCKICSKTLGSKAAACLHLRNIHKKKLKSCYKCANCSSIFAIKSALIMHSVVHMSKVRRDSATSSTSSGTSASVRHSVSQPRIESNVCNRNDSNTLHQSNVQRTEMESFSCDACDKSFRLRIMLADHHRRTHSVQASEEETVATSANSEPVVCPVNRTMSSNQNSDRGNTAQQTTTTVSVAEAIQTRIAAEEKVIEAKLREVAHLEGQIRGQNIIVEKVSEHTGTKLMTCGAGQTNQVDAFSDEYLVLRIDAEKGSIATKKKNFETLRQQVQSLQMKVEAWRLCLEL